MATPRFVTLSTAMYQVPGKRQANWQNGISPDKQADELPSFFNWVTEASEVRAGADWSTSSLGQASETHPLPSLLL